MKKVLYIIFVLLICSSLCFCATQNKQNTPPPQGQMGQRGPGGPGGHGKFGISNEDYNKLNLSKAQKTKVEAIEKKYKPQQQGQKPDMAKMQKNETAKQNEFRAILTDSQKKQYDKAKASQKTKQKEMFSKRYKELAKELKFTNTQTEKLNTMLKSFNGNPQEFDKKFESLLTASQKKTYNKKKEEFRQHGPGPQGPQPKK